MKTLFFRSSGILLLMIISLMSVKAQDSKSEDLKVNVNKLVDGINKIKQLEPISFQYDSSKYKDLESHLPSGDRFGFLEQSVAVNFPSLVQTNSYVLPTGKNSNKVAKINEVNKEELIPVLVAAIKEQQEQIEFLRQEINALKTQQTKTD